MVLFRFFLFSFHLSNAPTFLHQILHFERIKFSKTSALRYKIFNNFRWIFCENSHSSETQIKVFQFTPLMSKLTTVLIFYTKKFFFYVKKNVYILLDTHNRLFKFRGGKNKGRKTSKIKNIKTRFLTLIQSKTRPKFLIFFFQEQ